MSNLDTPVAPPNLQDRSEIIDMLGAASFVSCVEPRRERIHGDEIIIPTPAVLKAYQQAFNELSTDPDDLLRRIHLESKKGSPMLPVGQTAFQQLFADSHLSRHQPHAGARGRRVQRKAYDSLVAKREINVDGLSAKVFERTGAWSGLSPIRRMVPLLEGEILIGVHRDVRDILRDDSWVSGVIVNVDPTKTGILFKEWLEQNTNSGPLVGTEAV